MRKWLLLGMVGVAVGGVGGYWFFLRNPAGTDAHLVRLSFPVSGGQLPAGDGDAEPSDVNEPLKVDPGPTEVGALEGDFGVELEGVLRALLEPGMNQPPRPDAEPGKAPRMPYADETENPDAPKAADPTEESEPAAPEPPAVDPHQQHCPYHGGCPAPYRYR